MNVEVVRKQAEVTITCTEDELRYLAASVGMNAPGDVRKYAGLKGEVNGHELYSTLVVGL